MKIRFIVFLFLQSIVFPSDMDPTAVDIMRRIKSAPKPKSSVSEIRLEIIRKKAGIEKRRIRSFTRYEKQFFSGDYKKKQLLRFQEPKSVQGTTLLSWTKINGTTEQWFFLPKLKASKQIKTREKGKSFMGTDFIYEDLENREIKDDSLTLEGLEMIDGYSCYVVRTFPRIESSYWGTKVYVDEKIWQIRKIEFLEDENKMEKTLYIRGYSEESGFWSPTVLKMTRVNGNHTIMTIDSFKPNADLDDQIFTESFLNRSE